jgi:hypothetical protein
MLAGLKIVLTEKLFCIPNAKEVLELWFRIGDPFEKGREGVGY